MHTHDLQLQFSVRKFSSLCLIETNGKRRKTKNSKSKMKEMIRSKEMLLIDPLE
uniref:Uncharacterized protein n=1 Tax=Arundo donax TaxID=35708 RepID=A0A0A9B2X8_ARUDO